LWKLSASSFKPSIPRTKPDQTCRLPSPPCVQGRRGPARRLKKQASWLGIQRRSALREAAFQKLPPAAADSDGSEE